MNRISFIKTLVVLGGLSIVPLSLLVKNKLQKLQAGDSIEELFENFYIVKVAKVNGFFNEKIIDKYFNIIVKNNWRGVIMPDDCDAEAYIKKFKNRPDWIKETLQTSFYA